MMLVLTGCFRSVYLSSRSVSILGPLAGRVDSSLGGDYCLIVRMLVRVECRRGSSGGQVGRRVQHYPSFGSFARHISCSDFLSRGAGELSNGQGRLPFVRRKAVTVALPLVT